MITNIFKKIEKHIYELFGKIHKKCTGIIHITTFLLLKYLISKIKFLNKNIIFTHSITNEYAVLGGVE